MDERGPLFLGETAGSPEGVEGFMWQVLFRVVRIYAERLPLGTLRRPGIARPRPRWIRVAERGQRIADRFGIGRPAADYAIGDGPEDGFRPARRLGQAGVSGVTFRKMYLRASPASSGAVTPGSRETETHNIFGLAPPGSCSSLAGIALPGRSPMGEQPGIGEGGPFGLGEPAGPVERVECGIGKILLQC